jgi:electron transfer flavoprotein alpha subunit
MSVLVFTEINKGRVKKASLECVNYATKIASQIGGTVTAIAFGADDGQMAEIGKAGANKVLNAAIPSVQDAMSYSSVLSQAAQHINAKVVVFAFDVTGKSVAPYFAAKMKAGLVAGAVDYPTVNGNTMEIKKNVFSGKAASVCTITSELKVISLLPNSFPIVVSENAATVEVFSATGNSRLKVKEDRNNATGGVPLPEAELVVSAGRGLKGPENWGIIEELANTLGATTACSRPVSDMHWRPHHEHVGQTGIAIRPNLYIAIGISGAIQHLAGVNGSKTIVVINNDKEAPFFKSADYGIVGDAFTIVPKLTEAIKKFKAHQN